MTYLNIFSAIKCFHSFSFQGTFPSGTKRIKMEWLENIFIWIIYNSREISEPWGHEPAVGKKISILAKIVSILFQGASVL